MGRQNSLNLHAIARELLIEKGFDPDFSPSIKKQLQTIENFATKAYVLQDLRNLLWSSIDNDDSKDLDQLTYAEKKNGYTVLFVAIADADALIEKNSPIDQRALQNTTSIYTPVEIFPMLPTDLSNDLTSLNENQDRLAIVVSMYITDQGILEEAKIQHALVHNYAQLTYREVGAWLDQKAEIPKKITTIPGLEKTLQIQHEIAQILRKKRREAGTLTLRTVQPSVKILSDGRVHVESSLHNSAHELIEESMIAANSCVAKRLHEAQVPIIKRVVQKPKSWPKIVETASEFGEKLPEEPDAPALNLFLEKRKKADPKSFPDLSLKIIKFLGRGEYIVENDVDHPVGHFALALSHYTHSTAPNRRFPDLILQRQCKAFLSNSKIPYTAEELQKIASHCTEQSHEAMKIERRLDKSAIALLLSSRIGTVYSGIITGVSEKGVWVRIFNPEVEGKIVRKVPRIEVGKLVRVRLLRADPQKGFIDFAIE